MFGAMVGERPVEFGFEISQGVGDYVALAPCKISAMCHHFFPPIDDPTWRTPLGFSPCGREMGGGAARRRGGSREELWEDSWSILGRDLWLWPGERCWDARSRVIYSCRVR